MWPWACFLLCEGSSLTKGVGRRELSPGLSWTPSQVRCLLCASRNEGIPMTPPPPPTVME